MTQPKGVLTRRFTEKSKQKQTHALAPRPARLTPQPPPAQARRDFGTAAREEMQYLGDLEQVLQQINALRCLGPQGLRAQNERINRLLLSLLNPGTPYRQGRLKAELDQVVNRRGHRAARRIVPPRAFSCLPGQGTRPGKRMSPSLR